MAERDTTSRLTFKQWGYLFYTHAVNEAMGRMGTRHEQKDLQPLFTQYVHALITILLKGQGATDFHAKTPEKKRENWARKPLMFLGA